MSCIKSLKYKILSNQLKLRMTPIEKHAFNKLNKMLYKTSQIKDKTIFYQSVLVKHYEEENKKLKQEISIKNG